MSTNMLLYKKITRELENGILTGRFLPGACIPSVRELAEQYHVNPNTAMRAVREVKHMGLLVSIRGKGAVVTKNRNMICRLRRRRSEDLVSSFLLQMENMGYSREQVIALLREESCGHESVFKKKDFALRV